MQRQITQIAARSNRAITPRYSTQRAAGQVRRGEVTVQKSLSTPPTGVPLVRLTLPNTEPTLALVIEPS